MIIDPSYVLPGSDWEQFSLEWFRMPKITGLLTCHYGKYNFIVCSTHAGNGTWPVYHSIKGEVDSVDVNSGILAIMPKMMTYHRSQRRNILRLGTKIKITTSTIPISLIEHGDIKVGPYKVITSGETDDEDSTSSSYSTSSDSTSSDSTSSSYSDSDSSYSSYDSYYSSTYSESYSTYSDSDSST